MRNQVGIVGILMATGKFDIAQIARMPLGCRSRTAAMGHRIADVEMFTGTETAFASQIAGLVNMEAMFSRRELCKGDGKACLGSCLFGDGFTLDIRGVKDCYNYHCRGHLFLLSLVHILLHIRKTLLLFHVHKRLLLLHVGDKPICLLQILHLIPDQLVSKQIDDAEDDCVNEGGCNQGGLRGEVDKDTGAEKEEKSSYIECH
jgi:hypothetical protein